MIDRVTLTAVVAGVGTAGALIGVHVLRWLHWRAFREVRP